MLKGIDPLLTPDLLKVLAEMGHGDEIVIADANFTAASLAADKPLLHLAGAGVARAVEAVLSLLPIDQDVAQPIAYMQVSHQPEGWRSALQRHVIQSMAEQGHAQENQVAAVERFAFYDRVKQAYAIVLTSELQPYGNFILKKGVICEPLAG
ncbi:RbsD or FucU transport [Chitinibacter fontanus]|uniref:RbsD or FucU transport n=1 Tax=Chitinibacter fontanus TaxID=1737446 RepID=A0A7D5Z5R0_9NEIS|nr:RbsD/FucU domain-containing protein [Chitinibacter fontanus]QLI80942.1 RbsD or FucU transport [Chitinibacter fontanus]